MDTDRDRASAHRDYERVASVIRYVEQRFREQPTLSDVAAHLSLSESHLQRLFTRWAGISPKRFLQFVTARHARRLLRERRSVLDAAYASGLSGPGRLHDLIVNLHAVTPGELKREGEGVAIRFGIHPSPFGRCLIARTARGICALAFLDADGPDAAREYLAERWPLAALRWAPEESEALARRIFRLERPAAGSRRGDAAPIPLVLQGTNFQLRVWEALLRIPPGAVATYGDIATRIGEPGAARAVGAAAGRNPIAFLIPCHRVIRSTGAFGGYRWGETRKRALLAWESARVAEPDRHSG